MEASGAHGISALWEHPAEIVEWLNEDREFRQAARYWTVQVAFATEDDRRSLVIDNGMAVSIRPSEPEPDIVIAAPRSEWARLLDDSPQPFYHDVLAASLRHGFAITGDFESLIAHFAAVRRVLERISAQFLRAGAASELGAYSQRCSEIVGRYALLDIAGIEYRVYYEEAGRGIPLLCQHTAAADGRQYRHLLEDAWITERFRVIVPDLPFHGKSLPPVGSRWWSEEYRLTRHFFTGFVVALLDHLGVDRSVFLGCSIGGHLAGDLALEHPERLVAAIAVEGALRSESFGPARFIDHPRIQSPMGALIYSTMAPTVPLWARHETSWLYQQSVPWVGDGDNYFMVTDHDLTETAVRIDTKRTPFYVMSGEFDRSVTQEMGRRYAAAIPGASFVPMSGLGHMAVSEDPERFKQYLVPVLAQIVDEHQ